uniref:Uncharacterized protein n=1 Tax=Laticauda laticaudata TaxID=8630 RepID=A0A8C5RZV7_LATLA
MAAAAAASSAMGPGTAGMARVSCGRDLSCVPEVAGTLGAVARQGCNYEICGCHQIFSFLTILFLYLFIKFLCCSSDP